MNKLILFISLFLMSCSSYQEKADSLSSSHDQATARHKITHDHAEGKAKANGGGTAPHLKTLSGPPPKVALVSVYVVDPVKKVESEKMATAEWMKIAHAKTAANKIFENGFPAMKAEFARHHMDLLAPAEFLDTEKKKKFYKDFKLEHSPHPVQYAKNMLWGMTHHAKSVFQPANGFGEIYLMSAESMRAGTTAYDKTLVEHLGYDLTKGLNVNAVLIVLSQFTVQNGQTVHDETSMYMFGPNPVEKNGKPVDDYHLGHKYAGIRAPYDFVFEGHATNPKNFAGYGEVLKVMSRHMGEYLIEQTGFVEND